jgi:HlyD family secretion protein
VSGSRCERVVTWSALGVVAATFVSAGACASGEAAAIAVDVPSAEVRRGEWVDYLTVRGEIQAVRSIVLTAPASAGDLQIVRLVPNGGRIKKGDSIVEFDPTTVQRTVEEKRSELRQAEAEIAQARAQGRISEEESLTGQLSAEYNVERAKLDVQTNDVLPKLDQEKNGIKLDEARQKLSEAGVSVSTDRASTDAAVSSARQKREKAQADLQRAERNLAALTLRAPADGIVAIADTWSGSGPRPFRQGDRAWPGATVATLPDLREIVMTAKVDEIDRSRLAMGMAASVRVEALPGVELPASVRVMSTLAKPDFAGTWPPPRKFDITLKLSKSDERLRPGMTSSARLVAGRLANTLVIPAHALFQKDGRPVVYVKRDAGFVPRQVTVTRRGEESIAIADGVTAGERVALQSPERAAAAGTHP